MSIIQELELPAARSETAQAFFSNQLVKVVPGLLPLPEPEVHRWLVQAAAAVNVYIPTAEARKTAKATVNYQSMYKQIFNGATLGLEFGHELGQMYLVAMHVDKQKKSERIECQLWLGYEGLQRLAFGTGFLASVHTDVVVSDDEFDTWTDENGPHFMHRPQEPRSLADCKIQDIRFAYCVYQTTKGGKGFELVDASVLRQLAQRGNVWRSHPVAMCRKTAVKRCARSWDKHGDAGRRLKQAMVLDDEAERNALQTNLGPQTRDELPKAPASIDSPGWMSELDIALDSISTDGEFHDLRDTYLERCKSDDEKDLLLSHLEQWWQIEGPGN